MNHRSSKWNVIWPRPRETIYFLVANFLELSMDYDKSNRFIAQYELSVPNNQPIIYPWKEMQVSCQTNNNST